MHLFKDDNFPNINLNLAHSLFNKGYSKVLKNEDDKS